MKKTMVLGVVALMSAAAANADCVNGYHCGRAWADVGASSWGGGGGGGSVGWYGNDEDRVQISTVPGQQASNSGTIQVTPKFVNANTHKEVGEHVALAYRALLTDRDGATVAVVSNKQGKLVSSTALSEIDSLQLIQARVATNGGQVAVTRGYIDAAKFDSNGDLHLTVLFPVK